MSVAATGDLTLTGATTAGTASASSLTDPAGIQNGGFEKTETVDPDKNMQGQGAVSPPWSRKWRKVSSSVPPIWEARVSPEAERTK